MSVDKPRQGQGRGAGSQTNASDAVDDVQLPRHPTREQLLDEGVQETFPASDPVAIPAEGDTVWDRQQADHRRLLEDAQESLQDVHALLRSAALESRPLGDVVDAALSFIERAQQALIAARDERHRA